MSAGGVISFFKVDERHSEPAIGRAGFTGMFRMHFYPSASAHIQVGLELMTQSCAFNTYYFAPGHSVFYDRSFGYTHTLRTAELYVPIIGRIGLMPDEPGAEHIVYLMAGYSPKIFVSASTNITRTSNGAAIWGGATQLEFVHDFLGTQVGNVIIAGFGYDRRIHYQEKFFSFEAIFRYNLSQFRYTGRNDTNNLLVKNMCISLQVGYRFPGVGKSHGPE
jgi:hypothetical protein